MDWNGAIKHQDLQQPPQTSTESVKGLVRNKKQHTMKVQWGCEVLSHAYVPILHLQTGSRPRPLSGPPELCAPVPCPTQTRPPLLQGRRSSRHCWGARRAPGLVQPDASRSCKRTSQSAHLPEPSGCLLTWSQHWLRGAVRLQEPQVGPAQRAMEMLPPVLQDRQDSREPARTRPGINPS